MRDPALPANNFDFHPVAVCFHDQEIAEVFVDLLTAMRVKSEVLNPLHGAPRHRQIITESQYLPLLPLRKEQRCLVVGYEGTVRSPAILPLPQPLTLDAIEHALQEFLNLHFA